ncbi:unnamed protein product [Plutella xylostella]|uniref:PAT complex subunit CCDC47 n=1 Tax=Plutella xylostella TaxID=51655 RepID=A0A8S4FQ05_PLUXY|nr:unnamed protein product [Plutella xylostella]
MSVNIDGENDEDARPLLMLLFHMLDKLKRMRLSKEKVTETEKVLVMSINIDGENDEDARPLLMLLFHMLDKLKRMRLSKEALAKCEKRRQKVTEVWMRGAHAARQEQAAARREEKRKQEKERILQSIVACSSVVRSVDARRARGEAGAGAARREEKRQQEKERILQEDDPEKQRRWELKEQKRQLKRKTPKMKQLKVKAL